MEDIVVGRNPVLEAFRSEQGIEKIYIEKGEQKGSIKKIMALARKQGVPWQQVNRDFLDRISNGANHQGVGAKIADYRYYDYEGIFARLKKRNEHPFFVLLDQIQDPHNFGAILRTCEAAGVNGVFIPKHRSVGITPVVHKSSAGATHFVPVAKVTNLSDTIEKLKQDGLWIYGAAGEAENTLYQTDFSGNVALVIGNEGSGLGERVKKSCDVLVRIPMKGKVGSLNASNAAAILLYEVVRQHEA